ncbi:hypothetical protein C7C46_32280 [Streptomyces tateyamensis]|uniref:Uncharacterized protein n=1 Tax=Streptomyces tateyamensis TaxID=565073 RepID=A0A2V4MSP1_9ACTN|nr:hypothetical protein [Streptomyces tateyamensis]PYC65762.1 hypothetical protein C7C46_32280 [Streptomyces tateyamensis]
MKYSKERRPSVMTVRVYRITADGEREERADWVVADGEPYLHPISAEWPACRCEECRRSP